MWNIKNENDYMLYVNKNSDLELKVYNKQDISEIIVNYKGYNIIFAMEVWGFGEDCNERNINERIKGNVKEHPEDMYFSINKKDESALLDLVYFFLNENDADGMISPECRIYSW